MDSKTQSSGYCSCFIFFPPQKNQNTTSKPLSDAHPPSHLSKQSAGALAWCHLVDQLLLGLPIPDMQRPALERLIGGKGQDDRAIHVRSVLSAESFTSRFASAELLKEGTKEKEKTWKNLREIRSTPFTTFLIYISSKHLVHTPSQTTNPQTTIYNTPWPPLPHIALGRRPSSDVLFQLILAVQWAISRHKGVHHLSRVVTGDLWKRKDQEKASSKRLEVEEELQKKLYKPLNIT